MWVCQVSEDSGQTGGLRKHKQWTMKGLRKEPVLGVSTLCILGLSRVRWSTVSQSNTVSVLKVRQGGGLYCRLRPDSVDCLVRTPQWNVGSSVSSAVQLARTRSYRSLSSGPVSALCPPRTVLVVKDHTLRTRETPTNQSTLSPSKQKSNL